MPYLTTLDKFKIDMHERRASKSGELNYLVTMAILDYWDQSKQNYQAMNDIAGALTLADYEFKRRIIAPYEDKKIKQNGDVYPKQEDR